jgi:hypothetical protein
MPRGYPVVFIPMVLDVAAFTSVDGDVGAAAYWVLRLRLGSKVVVLSSR